MTPTPAPRDEREYDSSLASKCQAVAGLLTFNEGTPEAAAKYALLEASHRLDVHAVRVHSKTDGLLIINARGKSRFMTFREFLAYWLLGKKLEIRP